MKSIVAVLDACVLYPAPLRDFLMHLAVFDTFQAKWTEEIHAEWIRNVLKNRPDLKTEQLERTKQLMNAHTRDAIVENYESLIDSLKLPDENDRHVLAAAIYAKADLIVTFNLRDFPANELARYGVEAVHPDNFVQRLIESNANLVFSAAQQQWKSLKNPPKPLAEFLEILASNGLVKTVKYLCIMFEKEL
jgi:predicted nucleic acid-binding protein